MALDLRGVVGDEPAAVDISGLWKERYYLEITQKGTSVTGSFAQGPWVPAENHSHCSGPGQVYFEGTLRGRTFMGKLTVCTPKECVDELGIKPTTTTKFQFDVSEDCTTLSGGWLWEEYKYEREDGKMLWCRPSGFTEWLNDFSATRLLNCEAVKSQIKTMEQALALYKQFLANVTPPSGIWEVRDGKVFKRGTDIVVAEDFEALQDLLYGKVQSTDHGAGIGGEPNCFEMDQAAQGHIPEEAKQAYYDKYGRQMPDNPCWCWDNCGTCADWPDPVLYQMCVSHEQAHCRLLVAKCKEALRTPNPNVGAELWNEYVADIALHLQEEIRHYEDNLSTLRGELEATAHCN